MTKRTWDGTTPAPDERDLGIIREAVSFMLSERGLDRESRADGGLYAFEGQGGVVVRNTANTTRWVFTVWAAAETYVEEMTRLAEQGVSNSALMDNDRFEALLREKGLGGDADPGDGFGLRKD